MAQANEGQLFPLDKAFFFICNKPVHIDFERIGCDLLTVTSRSDLPSLNSLTAHIDFERIE